MGLAQEFRFEFESESQLIDFIYSFSEGYSLKKVNQLFVVFDSEFEFELAIEEYGFYNHRSGNYFDVFGQFIEQLTGKFGVVVISDV